MNIEPFEKGDLSNWRSWGQDYVNVNDAGHLEILPTQDGQGRVDLAELVSTLHKQSKSLPVLVRFPQIIDSQIDKLHESFRSAMRTFNYNSSYTAVYPLKVNHSPSALSRICRTGERYGLGLEVGTKAELCAALSLLKKGQGPVICNGFKDAAYLELASAAAAAGYEVVVLVERVREFEVLCDLIARGSTCPVLGARIKLHASGTGRWEDSSGYLSKFGLTVAELFEVTRVLRDAKLLSALQVLHFHLGSQITNIRKFKQALQEALRFYVELKKVGVPLRSLDVGGGLGIDYDGSNSASDSSVNYNVQEYANDVIYTTKEAAEKARIQEPNIITETGRFLVAHHAALLIDPLELPQRHQKSHRSRGRTSNVDAVNELEDLAVEINSKNWREYLHDAYQKKDEMLSAFSLGFLTLEQRAQAESAFARVVELASRYSRTGKFDKAEQVVLERIASTIYPFNFSLFKSMPDCWILDQLFPIMPVSRLREVPSIKAIIADLTCDSDGVIDKFAHPREVKSTIELHSEPWSDSYALAVLFVGAYQEALGSSHNLFGTPAEVVVEADAGQGFVIREAKEPQTCREILTEWGFNGELPARDFKSRPKIVSPAGGADAPSDADEKLRRALIELLDSSTYLNQTVSAEEGELSLPKGQVAGKVR
ncbi:MAG TPA: biosynthetic arginine decarboxylase [Candidatus Binatia bacterium]